MLVCVVSCMVDVGSVSVNGVDLQGNGMVQMAVVYRSSTPAATSPVGSDYAPVNGNQIDIQLPSSSVLFTAGVDGQTAGGYFIPRLLLSLRTATFVSRFL
jgi:hypothetical protein